MQTVDLSSQKRALATKGALRLLRVAGRVPAVVYGGGQGPVEVSVDGRDMVAVLKGHGRNILLNLKSDVGGELVLLKDLQRDVLTHHIIHVDFQRVSLTDKLEANVPLHILGEAPGVKLSGGILEHIIRELRVKCLATNLPDAINVDVTALQINQGLKVKDLVLPEGVEVLNEPEVLVVNIVAPSELEEAPAPGAAPVAAGTEPEVIAKGKKPEEGADAAPAPGKEGKAAAPAKDAKPAK